MLDRQQCSTTSIAIQLGHDHAVQLQGVIECLGTIDRVLARHAVHHQVDLIRMHSIINASQLIHQFLVDSQAAGGVQNHHPDILLFGLLHRRLTQLHRVRSRFVRVDGHSQLLANHVQLVNRCRALQVRGH